MNNNNEINKINIPINKPFIPIIQNKNNKKIFGYRGGRGSGKSYGVADATLLRCIQNSEILFAGRVTKNANDLSISKIYNQRLNNIFKQNPKLECLFKIKKEYIEFIDKKRKIESVIRFVGFGNQTIDNLTSSEMSMTWIDECHLLTKYTIDRLIPSVRKGDEQRIIFTYNPQLINDPVTMFLNTREDAVITELNFCDNPFFLNNKALVDEIVADKKRLQNKTITQAEFDHRWYGKPYIENENLLIPNELIERTVDFKSNNHLNYRKVMGVDVASDHGNDFSVIVIRQGNKIVDLVKFKGLDGCALAQRIIDYKARHNVCSIFIDATGVGHSPCDFLKNNFNCPYTPVDFGKISPDEKYDRYKTYIYYRLRKAVEDGLDFQLDGINNRLNLIEEIKTEMQYIPIVLLDNGKIRITRKQYIKNVIGRSPDILDAIAISYAYDTNDAIDNSNNIIYRNTRSKKISMKW